jgi:hypothetical protein
VQAAVLGAAEALVRTARAVFDVGAAGVLVVGLAEEGFRVVGEESARVADAVDQPERDFIAAGAARTGSAEAAEVFFAEGGAAVGTGEGGLAAGGGTPGDFADHAGGG